MTDETMAQFDTRRDESKIVNDNIVTSLYVVTGYANGVSYRFRYVYNTREEAQQAVDSDIKFNIPATYSIREYVPLPF